MDILTLTSTPDNERDPQWEARFFQALSQSQLALLSPDAQEGPDGWPYLLASTTGSTLEPAQNLIHWLSTRGMGLVINPQKEYPDYVFSYGMVWSFKETGFFYKPLPPPKEGQIEFDINSIAHAGTPTPEYLPDYVRKILREFFRDQGLLAVKILLISQDRIQYDLAFSVESLGKPKDEELPGIAEAIGWFLPPHYTLLLVSQEGLPPFTDL
jgi:hypothetical protein